MARACSIQVDGQELGPVPRAVGDLFEPIEVVRKRQPCLEENEAGALVRSQRRLLAPDTFY
jgi:hypothetical protein